MNPIDTHTLALHTTLSGLSQQQSMLLIARPDLDPLPVALATAVAVAAGNTINGHSPGWCGPVVVLSDTRKTKELQALSKKQQATLGTADASALTLIGTDHLAGLGFAITEDFDRFEQYREALRQLLIRTEAKLVVLDLPSAYLLTVSLAHVAAQRRAAVLGTTNILIDRQGQSAFQFEAQFDLEDGETVLRHLRPGNPYSRRLSVLGS